MLQCVPLIYLSRSIKPIFPFNKTDYCMYHINYTPCNFDWHDDMLISKTSLSNAQQNRLLIFTEKGDSAYYLLNVKWVKNKYNFVLDYNGTMNEIFISGSFWRLEIYFVLDCNGMCLFVLKAFKVLTSLSGDK